MKIKNDLVFELKRLGMRMEEIENIILIIDDDEKKIENLYNYVLENNNIDDIYQQAMILGNINNQKIIIED